MQANSSLPLTLRREFLWLELVRLAFGKCEPDDVSFDLRKTMLDRRVKFIEAEVAHIDPHERKVIYRSR